MPAPRTNNHNWTASQTSAFDNFQQDLKRLKLMEHRLDYDL